VVLPREIVPALAAPPADLTPFCARPDASAPGAT